jgi:hypothetical protein
MYIPMSQKAFAHGQTVRTWRSIYLPKHPIRRQRVPEVSCVQSAPSPCTISIIISSIIDNAWHHAFHFSNHRRLYIADAFLGKKKANFTSVTHILASTTTSFLREHAFLCFKGHIWTTTSVGFFGVPEETRAVIEPMTAKQQDHTKSVQESIHCAAMIATITAGKEILRNGPSRPKNHFLPVWPNFRFAK